MSEDVTKDDVTEEEIAYHEAGHAVIAIVLKQGLYAVSLNPMWVSLGNGNFAKYQAHTTCARRQDSLSSSERLGDMVRLEAGPVAQYMFAGNLKGDVDDRRQRDRILAKWLKPERHEERSWIRELVRDRAVELVWRHWASIEAIASALLERRRLKGPELRRIFLEADDAARTRIRAPNS